MALASGDKAGMFFDEKEGMPPKEREEYLNQNIREFVRYAYDNAPTMRNRMDKTGINPSQIQRLKDLEKIPLLKRVELVQLEKEAPPFGGLLGIPLGTLERFWISPGPLYEPQDGEEEFQVEAKALYAAGLRKGGVFLNTVSHHMVPAGFRVTEGARMVGAKTISAGGGSTDLQVQVMHDLKVIGYGCSASFLITLIERAEEMGYDFRRNFALRFCWLTGEKFSSDTRKRLENYGVAVFEGYGIGTGGIAYECEQHSGMHVAEELILEIVNPETGKQLGPGEIGEIVVTKFKKGFPLLRFATGDLSTYIDEPCPCGRTSPRISGILGRIGDETKVRGQFITPKQVETVISRSVRASAFQFVVSRPEGTTRDKVKAKVELADEVVDKDKETNEIKDSFRKVCGLKLDVVELVPQGTIPEGAKMILDERVWD